MKDSAIGTALLVALLASSSDVRLMGQERLMMDVSAGRVILAGTEYYFLPAATIDHERRILYVVDAIEPLAAMAVSIDDGSIVRMYGGSKGDGPGELRRLTSIAPTEVGVMASGGGVINHWSMDGALIGTWRPTQAPRVPSQCVLDGQPVVPTLDGASRADTDGSWPALGSRPGGRVESGIFGATRVACVDGVAYVLDERLTGYPLDGRPTGIPLDEELDKASRNWRESLRRGAIGHPYAGMHDTGTGRLFVVLPRFAPGDLYGAIIDPETGCHALIAAPDLGTRRTHRPIGMYRDSLVVTESEVSVREVNGEQRRVLDTGSSKIALRPLRPAGGTPCPNTPRS